MSNKSKWTRELNATVTVQTMEYLTEHSKNLDLSKEDELKETIYDVMCMMVLPLFQTGNKPDDVWFEVLTRVEDILKQGSAFNIL